MKHNRGFVLILALMIFAFNSPVMTNAQTYHTGTTDFDTSSNVSISGDADLDWIIYRAGERAGVDPRFIHAVIKQESRYENEAISQVGAQGLMQLMPATAKRFGNTEPYNAEANVEAGTKYLKWLLRRFNGDINLAPRP
ncbi:MAG TPA: hypothetical protein DC047_18130 [Blastocatellia bacterium]|nr:hypothetical protein [Blastocatellia bacterium]